MTSTFRLRKLAVLHVLAVLLTFGVHAWNVRRSRQRRRSLWRSRCRTLSGGTHAYALMAPPMTPSEQPRRWGEFQNVEFQNAEQGGAPSFDPVLVGCGFLQSKGKKYQRSDFCYARVRAQGATFATLKAAAQAGNPISRSSCTVSKTPPRSGRAQCLRFETVWDCPSMSIRTYAVWLSEWPLQQLACTCADTSACELPTCNGLSAHQSTSKSPSASRVQQAHGTCATQVVMCCERFIRTFASGPPTTVVLRNKSRARHSTRCAHQLGCAAALPSKPSNPRNPERTGGGLPAARQDLQPGAAPSASRAARRDAAAAAAAPDAHQKGRSRQAKMLCVLPSVTWPRQYNALPDIHAARGACWQL